MNRVTTETLQKLLDDFKKVEQERNFRLLRGEYLSNGVNPERSEEKIQFEGEGDPVQAGCPCPICQEARRKLFRDSQLLGRPTYQIEVLDRQGTPLYELQAVQGFTPDYERGDVVEIDKPSRGGDVDPRTGRQIILPADLNHGREGPIWSAPKAEGEPYEVWFEDGILPYEGRDLNATGDSWDMSTIPEIRPKEGVVKDAIEKLYPNPGHVFSRSHRK